MPKYYVTYDSTWVEGRKYWLGSNNQWVDYQCNALVFDNLEAAKASLVEKVTQNVGYPHTNSSFKIVEEKTTFDVVYEGHQTIVSKLQHLAHMVYDFYTPEYLSEEIRKIAKEIKQ